MYMYYTKLKKIYTDKITAHELQAVNEQWKCNSHEMFSHEICM